jgi:TonB-linked SusC/RagA family outer membrane protein
MMKQRFYVLLAALLLTGSAATATAQDLNVSGTVRDANSDPVVGATVMVKGTTTGVTTGVNGDYDIQAPADATLTFSFVGLGTIEVAVGGRGRIDVVLNDDSQEIEEVLVVAYGTAKRSTFTGSASVMKSDVIEKRQVSNITSALTGSVAGVQGLSSTGEPGTTSTIRIRGVGSITAGNSPLYVVDGIPYDGDITAINPADVDNITVLKDAASNALYGARGANGVIMVTTKRGKTGDAQVTVDAKWGTNRRGLPFYNVMTDPAMYYETAYQAVYNSLGNYETAYNSLLTSLGYDVFTPPNGERMIGTNGKINPNATLGKVVGDYYIQPDDWYNELFNKGNLRQEYNATVSGATDKINYFISAGYLDDNGIITNSGFQRFTGRAKGDYQVKKWLKVGANISFTQNSYASPDEVDNATSSGNLFYIANFIAPIYPIYIRNADGSIKHDNSGKIVYDYGDGKILPASYARGWTPGAQPASQIELDKRYYLMEIVNAKWYADVNIWNGLSFSANWGINADNTRLHQSVNPFYGQYKDMGGYVWMSQSRTFSVDQNYLLKFVHTFGEHNLDLFAGVDAYNRKYSYMSGQKDNLFDPEVAEWGNAINNPNINSYTRTYATLGYLTQAKYNYAEKYFLSLSFRRDASSVFSPENRWGNFWSAGVAYNIKKESFMSNLKFVDMLKLKASYGQQGNDYMYYPGTSTRNYFAYQDQYDIIKNGDGFATTLYYKGNKDITWETSNTLNTGVDFILFDNKITGTIEYFNRRTTDMLYNLPTPGSMGYSSFPINVGAMTNQGVEIDLSGVVFQNENIKANLMGNITFISNKINELDESLTTDENGKRYYISGSRMYKEGASMYNLYLRKFVGVNSVGESLWTMSAQDIENQRNSIREQNAADPVALQRAMETFEKTLFNEETATNTFAYASRYEMGNVMPTAYGGFGASVEAYGFDLSVQFAYQMGGRIMDYTYQDLMHSGTTSDLGQNWHKDILNAWTPENSSSNIPRLNSNDTYGNGISDRFVVSSNFLNLQNITLGYTLPKNLTNRLQVSNVRVYCAADNLKLWSARKGLDPRQGYVYSEGNYYSPMMTISGGVKITF